MLRAKVFAEGNGMAELYRELPKIEEGGGPAGVVEGAVDKSANDMGGGYRGVVDG